MQTRRLRLRSVVVVLGAVALLALAYLPGQEEERRHGATSMAWTTELSFKCRACANCEFPTAFHSGKGRSSCDVFELAVTSALTWITGG